MCGVTEADVKAAARHAQARREAAAQVAEADSKVDLRRRSAKKLRFKALYETQEDSLVVFAFVAAAVVVCVGAFALGLPPFA